MENIKVAGRSILRPGKPEKEGEFKALITNTPILSGHISVGGYVLSYRLNENIPRLQ